MALFDRGERRSRMFGRDDLAAQFFEMALLFEPEARVSTEGNIRSKPLPPAARSLFCASSFEPNVETSTLMPVAFSKASTIFG